MSSQQWFEDHDIAEEYANIPILQVNCWMYSTDHKLILVSKDGYEWHFPGGKPLPGEYMIHTCVREVREETGLDINSFLNEIKFFGYYLVTNSAAEASEKHEPTRFLQVRLSLALDRPSDDLLLIPQDEESPDAVKLADLFTLEQSFEAVLWLQKSPELQSFLKIASFV